MLNIKVRFIKFLYNYSSSKIMLIHLAKYGNDTKCSNCQTWASIRKACDFKDEYINTEFGYSCLCGQCKKYSWFNTVDFPFPTPCDPDGYLVLNKIIDRKIKKFFGVENDE